MACKRCGNCCSTYSFWLGPERKTDNDTLEIARLISYHGCTPVKNKKTGELGIRIPLTCIQLEIKDGKTKCRVHDTKPVVCREYYCDGAKD